MMSHLFLMAAVVLSSVSGFETIQWNANHRLTWNDFKASPPVNASNAALTSSGILMSFTTNGETFTFKLSCNFDQNSSWGRVKNDYILAHEQGHFDIAELVTRKLNKALKAYRYRSGTFNKDVNKIYQDTMKELQETQSMYDQQTDHSRNVPQQKEWLISIRTSLANLQAFSSYK